MERKNRKVNCSRCVYCRCILPVKNFKNKEDVEQPVMWGRFIYGNTQIFCEQGLWFLKGDIYIHKGGLNNFMEKSKYTQQDRYCGKYIQA